MISPPIQRDGRDQSGRSSRIDGKELFIQTRSSRRGGGGRSTRVTPHCMYRPLGQTSSSQLVVRRAFASRRDTANTRRIQFQGEFMFSALARNGSHRRAIREQVCRGLKRETADKLRGRGEVTESAEAGFRLAARVRRVNGRYVFHPPHFGKRACVRDRRILLRMFKSLGGDSSVLIVCGNARAEILRRRDARRIHLLLS